MSGSVCRSSYPRLVRGELRKVAQQRANWLLVAGAVVAAAIAGLILSTSSGIWQAEAQFRATLNTDPAYWVHGVVVVGAMIIRVAEGTLLLFAAARLVGTEYSAGTIRVLAARGVGQLRLLTAKLLGLVVFGLAITAGLLLLAGLYILLMIAVQGGSPLHVVAILPGSEWRDVWIHVAAVLISAVACVLIGVAGAAVTRSLPLAMVIAVLFFPVDNLIAGNRDYNVYQLGVNLNVLPETLGHMRESIFDRPAEPVDSPHTLIVIGVYLAIFLVIAYASTWRREVKE
jgi:ABC-type transport system involved in multi-copper enzyme maturation permease subunit